MSERPTFANQTYPPESMIARIRRQNAEIAQLRKELEEAREALKD